MADNTTLNTGSGGDTFRSEDLGGGIKMAVSKIYLGAHAVDGGPVTASNPMPVSGTVSATISALAACTITGALPTGTNTIGAVTVPAVTISGSLPTGSNTIGAVTVPNATISGSLPAGGNVIGGVTANLTQVSGVGIALGQALSASSLPVVLPASQVTTLTPPAAITGFALDATLATVASKLGTLGQKAMVGSAPVVIASDQSAVPASLATLPPLVAGTAVIGHVIADSGSTTVVTGNVAVTAAALPLPAGASTSAKQPALGTAGAASADVLTVQGVASMTALKVDGSGVTQPVSGAFFQATQPISVGSLPLPAGAAADATVAKLNVAQAAALGSNSGPMVQGSVTTAAPTYVAGQVDPLSLNTSGGLRVDGSGVTQPVSGTVAFSNASIVANAGTNLNTSLLALESGGNLATLAGAVTAAKVQSNTAQINGVAPTMGNGVAGTGVQRVTLASDSTGQVVLAAGSAVVGHVIADSGSTTAVTGNVTIVQPTGTNLHAVVDSGTITAVTAITNALPAGTNTIGNAVPVAATTGGATPYRYVAAAAANQDSTNVKPSAGQVYTIALGNVNAAARFVKLYDKASAPTSADTPVQTLIVPGATTGSGSNLSFPVGATFALGIGFRITTGMADADTGAATAGDVIVNLTYK